MRISSKAGIALAAIIVLFSLSGFVLANGQTELLSDGSIICDEEETVLSAEDFIETESVEDLITEAVEEETILSEEDIVEISTEITEVETVDEGTSGEEVVETEIYVETESYIEEVSKDETIVSVSYRVTNDNNEWSDWADDGMAAVLSEEMAGVEISVTGDDSLDITYTVYNSEYGWSNWAASGTAVVSECVQAVRISLTGENAGNYSIYYSVGFLDGSWTMWVQDKEPAGSLSAESAISALRVKIVAAGTVFDTTEKPDIDADEAITETTEASDTAVEAESSIEAAEVTTEAVTEVSTEIIAEVSTEAAEVTTEAADDKESIESEISSEDMLLQEKSEECSETETDTESSSMNSTETESSTAIMAEAVEDDASEEVYEGTFHIKTEEDEQDIIFVQEEGAAYTGLTSSNRGSVSALYAFPNVYINSGNIKKDLIKIAAGQVGYYRLEGTSTKYGTWYGYPTSAWCAMFVSWCADQAAVPSNVIKPFCRCATEAAWFKGLGKWKNPAGYTPVEGDIIFFNYNGSRINHVGIVTGVEGNYVYCIEGNHGDAVDITRHKLTASYISGYGTPDYSGGKTQSSTSDENVPQVKYSVHVRSTGWLDYVLEGKTAGTTGEARRMEAVQISLTENATVSGGISYRVHVRSYGWLPWVSNGAVAGTTGESRRMEAIEIVLTGKMAEYYDVYYRAHVQTYGWLDWAKNGEMAGTSGMYLRLEALEIELVKKGGQAPGSTAVSYYVK